MSTRVTQVAGSVHGPRTLMPEVPSPTLSTKADAETTCPGLFGAILHVSRDALWSWNKAGVITSWNAEGEHLLGYAAKEIVGESVSVLFPAEHLEEARSVLLSVQGGNWYRNYATILRKKGGTPVSVKLTISSFEDYHHLVVGGLAICREQRSRRQTAAILARRVQELTALFKFSERLQNASSLPEAYEAAVVSVLEALQCDRAALLLLDGEGVMRFVAWHALSEAYRSAVEGHSPWRSDAAKPEPICIHDVSDSSLPDPLKHVVEAEGIRGLAFIPVILDNQIIGKFMSYYNIPHHFSDAEMTLALTVSRQLAVSIGRQRAAALEQTLTREVQHRSNNLLAVIQAIAQRSLSGNLSLEEAKEKFEARLHALARAHHNLMKSNWSRINLGDLVRSELEPFSARADIQGPEILLGPQQAQSFSLALHELATNAVKHGALSSDSGRVTVDWFLGDSTELTFRWREEGGPAVANPSRQGFGTTLLTSTFAKASLNYSPGGVSCELNVLLQGY
jgi:PAS domain S-box-containing protein